SLGSLLVGLERLAVAHQLERAHGPNAAGLAHKWKAVGEGREATLDLGPERGGALEQAVVLQGLDRAEGGGARHRVPAEGAAEPARLGGVHEPGAAHGSREGEAV